MDGSRAAVADQPLAPWARWTAALVAWAAVAILPIAGAARGDVSVGTFVAWASLHLVFLTLLGLAGLAQGGPRQTARGRLALSAASLAALAGIAVLPLPVPSVSPGGVLLAVVAAGLPAVFTARAGLAVVAVQSALLLALYRGLGWPWPISVFAAGAFTGLQLFAFFVAIIAERERRGRAALATTLEELRAAQSRLAEGERRDERLRIARDLHDAIGHHLTGLALQLEAATHRIESGSPALPHVERAALAARTLLAEVRDVVGELRDPAPVDLVAALRAIAASVSEPPVRLRIGDTVEVNDPVRVHALVRVAQEAVTNAVRHSGAGRIDVELDAGDGVVRLVVVDDGAGAAPLVAGNGLRGVEERLRALGGSLEIESRRGGGLRLTATLPCGSVPAEEKPPRGAAA